MQHSAVPVGFVSPSAGVVANRVTHANTIEVTYLLPELVPTKEPRRFPACRQISHQAIFNLRLVLHSNCLPPNYRVIPPLHYDPLACPGRCRCTQSYNYGAGHALRVGAACAGPRTCHCDCHHCDADTDTEQCRQRLNTFASSYLHGRRHHATSLHCSTVDCRQGDATSDHQLPRRDRLSRPKLSASPFSPAVGTRAYQSHRPTPGS